MEYSSQSHVSNERLTHGCVCVGLVDNSGLAADLIYAMSMEKG
jgi:hypothetical protein